MARLISAFIAFLPVFLSFTNPVEAQEGCGPSHTLEGHMRCDEGKLLSNCSVASYVFDDKGCETFRVYSKRWSFDLSANWGHIEYGGIDLVVPKDTAFCGYKVSIVSMTSASWSVRIRHPNTNKPRLSLKAQGNFNAFDQRRGWVEGSIEWRFVEAVREGATFDCNSGGYSMLDGITNEIAPPLKTTCKMHVMMCGDDPCGVCDVRVPF